MVRLTRRNYLACSMTQLMGLVVLGEQARDSIDRIFAFLAKHLRP
jgi:hypothetical protein